MKRIIAEIDSDLHQKFKEKAVKLNLSMKHILEILITEYIGDKNNENKNK